MEDETGVRMDAFLLFNIYDACERLERVDQHVVVFFLSFSGVRRC
jgi:hypothetical protein